MLPCRQVALAAALLLSACSPPSHVPDFARLPYQPFSRDAAVAIALREWRLFGAPVRDEPPGARTLPDDEIPMRQEGLWQRVGEYWWLGQNAGSTPGAWTGKHDQNGREFPPEEDDRYAWSAAFISYVMRVAGAGDRFPYAIAHATYIDKARRVSLGMISAWAVSAQPPGQYAPRPGDLICTGRDSGASIRFEDLPAPSFPSHCDLVVSAQPGSLSVVGGNVGSAVAMKHVPVATDGKLVGSDGQVLDTRYPWFVVLNVLYDR